MSCASLVLHEITGFSAEDPGYFPVADTERLLDTVEAWSEPLFTKAFDALAKEVEERLQEEEIGPHSLVRQRKWWLPPYSQFRDRVLDQLRNEKEWAEEAARQGVTLKAGLTDAIPLPLSV